MEDIRDDEVRVVGGKPKDVGEWDNIVVDVEPADNVTRNAQKSVAETIDTRGIGEILNLWRIMYELGTLYNDPSVWDEDDSWLDEERKQCLSKISELEDEILVYKDYLTKDKVYRLYKNGSENFVVSHLDELKWLWLLSPELGFAMIDSGFSNLVMPNLIEFGLLFNEQFVDKLIEREEYGVIIDYIEYAEPHKQGWIVAKVIEAWWSYEIWSKLWKAKGLDIKETIELMLAKDIDPNDIWEWLDEYFRHVK